MKTSTLALLFLSCALLLSACAQAQVRSTPESDWKFLMKDEDDGLEWETYYDLNSVKRNSNIIAVWLKQLPVFKNDEQRQRLIRSTTENRKMNKMDVKGYEKYSFSQTLVEVDCKGKSGRSVAIKDFDGHGSLLGSDAKESVPFAPVRDGSLAGFPMEALCH